MPSINWTNASVLRFAGDRDPVEAIEEAARAGVLAALDAGWKGPPFNPIALADIRGIPVEANADVRDARTVAAGDHLRIQFNPTQLRERVRFSIAHEVAHTLFKDAGHADRHRGGDGSPDDWQLEMLCNIAAAEFVMPVGSLGAIEKVQPIEELMKDRRRFDVSAEAYLLRVCKAMARAQGPRIILLSGPIGAGKSQLASGLAKRHGARILRTRDLIRAARADVPDDRAALQRAGTALDRADGGEWVKTALFRLVETMSLEPDPPTLVAIDAVRIEGQIAAVRSAFGTLVHHIHLTASEAALAARYASRGAAGDADVSFEAARRQGTERGVAKLATLADILVETDRSSEDAVLTRATALLGLYPRSVTPLVDVLVGGQYGSEGKGNIVGHIAPEYNLLVRVGGPNAGHKVFGDPVQVYYHLPSGSRRAPHARLLLGAGAVLRVPKLLAEINDHGIEADRLSIDPQAMIIEDEDIAREADLAKGISSTQQGVGSASANKIMGRAGPAIRLARNVPELRPYLRDAQDVLEEAYLKGRRIMLEGTQGTTLSMHHGPYPFVTSRDTTAAGCLADAGISPMRVRRIIMVCRTYPIRVGGPSGPMVGELTYEELGERSGIPIGELKATEMTTTTKRQRRIAEFDWVQLRRSALLNGPTDIALTFTDYLGIGNRGAYRMEQLNGFRQISCRRVEPGFRNRRRVPLRGFQDGQHGRGVAEELQSTMIGGHVLVGAETRVEEVAQFVIAATEPSG